MGFFRRLEYQQCICSCTFDFLICIERRIKVLRKPHSDVTESVKRELDPAVSG